MPWGKVYIFIVIEKGCFLCKRNNLFDLLQGDREPETM